jgi:vacuolar-type H+-ATPase subunit E/Vma4
LIEHTPSASEQVKKAGETALEKYKDISGRTSTIEYKDSLSDDTCSGGVIGSMMQGRIKVDNTLDERLKILEEQVSLCGRLEGSFTHPAIDVARDQNRSVRKEPQP